MNPLIMFATGETGADAFTSALTTGITSDTLWAEITKFAPIIIVFFVVAVGYRVLRKVLKGGSKLKASI